MAKKIILAFNSSLETGAGSNFTYQIQIEGFPLVYTNGLNIVDVSYNTTGYSPPSQIKKESNLNDTILNTLNFLNTHYSNRIITYTKIENTIEIFIDSDIAVVSGLYSANTGVVTRLENVNIIVEGEIKLKYFFQYKNIVNDEYRFEIFQVGYTGSELEIYGRAIIEKASSKDHLDPVRGTSVTVNLEANLEVDLQDLYSQNELDFPVKLYKNDKLIFRGFLNPDGVFQSFTRGEWIITFDCVDGLGAIDNLSFVKDNGLRFVGKMSVQEIIFNCLRRTGMLQKINTAVNIFYIGYEELPNRNVFESIFLTADRFIKEDDDTIMSCGDVLRSILDIFNACITQEDGEWYIYRPNEIYQNSYVEFKKYDISNIYTNTVTKNLNKLIGSQIDNFYPHHCAGDQKIQIKGSISAFRINYKYGFSTGILINKDLFRDKNLNYPNWEVNEVAKTGDFFNPQWLLLDPTVDNGVFMTTTDNARFVMKSFPYTVEKNYTFKFKATVSTNNSGGGAYHNFKVQVGIYFLDFLGRWTTDDSMVGLLLGGEGVLTLDTEPLPIGGDLTVSIYTPRDYEDPFGFFPPTLTTTVRSVDIINTFKGNNIVGEFHTVQRGNSVSSIVKENKTVSNGDNTGIAYIGAIYKIDQTTLTSFWSRKGAVENKPILQIATEESLRISQKPLQIFQGSFLGSIPYLSVLNINNLDGKFMAIEYSYDTFTNIGTAKWLQLFSNDLPDINYKFTYDYGETVKPTITS